ncbi:ribonuclease T2 [Roseibium hamelinense]|uniref:Ribonuclease T2 n=1 Tax=Roseibium hamelinense TaxID=150831 RepID=A0A562SYT4_9HYPH|nr:ribonuclease T2 [Roseibium hamelinense]TWI86174.1 ribonuclease T2 [Roseibium hamelinense]
MAAAATCLLLALAAPAGRADDTAGEFDYYVLALSWSPTYCREKGRNADPLQCRAQKPHRFIVHGLWPQYDRGWPDYCPVDLSGPNRTVVDEILDIMPSRGLAFHQWKKHGTCSGLTPEGYFDLTRKAFDQVKIPAAFQNIDRTGNIDPDGVEKAFRLANPNLRNNAIAVSCSGGFLKEVRICFNKDLDFQSCPAVDRRGCSANRISVPFPR